MVIRTKFKLRASNIGLFVSNFNFVFTTAFILDCFGEQLLLKRTLIRMSKLAENSVKSKIFTGKIKKREKSFIQRIKKNIAGPKDRRKVCFRSTQLGLGAQKS